MTRWTVALVLGLLAPAGALADWPERPVRLIVPYAAGAMGDVVSRVIAEEVRPRLGQPLVVEARPGAAGNIGTAAVAQSAPDGYTVLVGATNNFVINQFLYRDLGFDPLEALEPVTVLVEVPSVIFVNGALPARTFAEFVQHARGQRGRLNYGSPGPGTTPHLSAALIDRLLDLGMTHVPYKGAQPAITALLANEIQLYLVGAGLGAQHAKAGKLHALAVSGARRLEALPDTPTFREVGLGEVRASNYWGAAVRRGTPAAITQKLYDSLRAALGAPAVQERFRKLGVEAVGDSPADTARRMREEAAYWSRAIREMNVRVD